MFGSKAIKELQKQVANICGYDPAKLSIDDTHKALDTIGDSLATLAQILGCPANPMAIVQAVAGVVSTGRKLYDATQPSVSLEKPATKPFVYIASPYTKGDPAINTHFQCRTFDLMLTDGIVWPYAPLVSHFQHTLFPRDYHDWIDYDLAMLERFDACVRLDAKHASLHYKATESSGADGEVAAFQKAGKPVFYSIEECYRWAEGNHV